MDRSKKIILVTGSTGHQGGATARHLMENFNSLFWPQPVEGVLTFSLALRPDKTLQMIAVDDIGGLAALAFEQPETFIGQAI